LESLTIRKHQLKSIVARVRGLTLAVETTEKPMKDPDGYLKEIRDNLQKIQAQGKVSPTENALFGMLDGLAGLQMATMERLAELNRRVQDLESRR
jgi:hypothetical protein